MCSPLIDCFQQSKTNIDIMTFIQPINSNARLNFSHSYKEISSVVWLALRYAVKFLPGRKSTYSLVPLASGSHWFNRGGGFLHEHPATPVPLVLGSFLTQKALSFGCIPLIRVSHFSMRRAVHTELSPCYCPPNIRCLVYGSISWSAIRPEH